MLTKAAPELRDPKKEANHRNPMSSATWPLEDTEGSIILTLQAILGPYRSCQMRWVPTWMSSNT